VIGFILLHSLDIQSIVDRQIEQLTAAGLPIERLNPERMAMQTKWQLLVGSAVSGIIVALIIAGFIKLFSLFVSAVNRFKSIFCVTLFATIAIAIIQQILIVVILKAKGPAGATIGNLDTMVASNVGAILSGLMGPDALPRFLMHFLALRISSRSG